MSKLAAFICIVLALTIGGLMFVFADSFAAKQQNGPIQAHVRPAVPQNKMEAAAAAELAKSMEGLQKQFGKGQPGGRRAQVMAAQRAKDPATGKRESASNRIMVSAWYANDVVERLRKSGMTLETSEPKWQGDPEGINRAGFADALPWGLMCKPNEGSAFLVIRLEKEKPQRKDIAMATCEAAAVQPYQWGNFVLGFADEAQREKVLAALPRID